MEEKATTARNTLLEVNSYPKPPAGHQVEVEPTCVLILKIKQVQSVVKMRVAFDLHNVLSALVSWWKDLMVGRPCSVADM